MNAPGVKLMSSGLSVIIPNEIPTVEGLSNESKEPSNHSLHEHAGSNKDGEEVSQVSRDDGVGGLEWGLPHSVRTVAETISVASGLINVKLLGVGRLRDDSHLL